MSRLPTRRLPRLGMPSRVAASLLALLPACSPPASPPSPSPAHQRTDPTKPASGPARVPNLSDSAATPLLEPSPEPKTENEAPPPLEAPPIAERMHELRAWVQARGVGQRPRVRHRGPESQDEFLMRAYQQGRAMNFEGELAEIRAWVQQLGGRKRGEELPVFDLVVTRRSLGAWMHLVLPEDPRGYEASTWGLQRGIRWIHLQDALALEDYVLFKRDGAPAEDRQWGREPFVRALADLARSYRQRTGERLGIGDISYLTGGKMPDHWTHRVGRDADLYILLAGEQRVSWHRYRKGRSAYTRLEHGGAAEPTDSEGHSESSRKLLTLAELALPIDELHYFVHDDPRLRPFDEQAEARRPGRHFIHRRNRGYWPPHRDHVHLRWNPGPLDPEAAPKP